MINREFTAVYKKTGRWISAWIEEIPGVNTQGKTLKEAKENLREAIQMILRTNRMLAAGGHGIKRESLSIAVPV